MNKISVCIATYNGEKYIKEQLKSIIPQLKKDDEIIISDDYSNDNTLKIIKSFRDHRIKIFTNPKKGLIFNFENAILNSSGDYIFLSDQDDIWHKNKVKICLEDFKNNYDLVYSDCEIFDSETSKIIVSSFFEFYNCKKGVVNNILKNTYMGCCMSFKANLKNKILPFPKYLPMHDSWIGINAEIYFNVKHNTQKLIKHRRHENNASETGSRKGSRSILTKFYWRVSLSYSLIVNFLKKKY